MAVQSKRKQEVIDAAQELSGRLAGIRVIIEPAILAGWTALERQWASNWLSGVERAVAGLGQLPHPPFRMYQWMTKRQIGRDVAAFWKAD